MQDQESAADGFGDRAGMGQHGRAVLARHRRGAEDHERRHVDRLLLAGAARELGQGRSVGTEMVVAVGQLRRLAHQHDVRAVQPGLADAGVENGRLARGIGADQDDVAGTVDILDRRGPGIARALRGQQRTVGPAFGDAAQGVHQRAQREGRLGRDQIADESGDGLALHRRRGGGQRLWPGRRTQLAVLAEIGLVEPLPAQPVPDEAGLVADPFLVGAVVVARQDPHHLPALGIDADAGAERVHDVDRLGLGQLPGPRGEGVGLGDQRADRAEVDDVALQVRFQRLAQIGVISASSPRPVWPICVTPATSVVKRTQRVQEMQRVMCVSTSGPRSRSTEARLGSR